MTTGIPLLDSIISGVNTAVSTIQTAVSNTQNYIATTTNQAQNQLGQFVGGVSNAIGGIISGVQNQVVPQSTSYAPSVYNPYSNGYVQYQQPQVTYAQPLQQPGTTYAPTIYNPYSNQSVQYQQQPTTVTLQGFDFNTVYSAVNAAFQQLPNILATINNPLNSPYLAMLQPLYNQLIQYSNGATQALQQLVKDVETHLYQSTSQSLQSVGIDVGGFSNLLDAAVRTVMEQLGYDFNQRMVDIQQMNAAGLSDLNQKIYNTQAGINQLLQSLSYTTDVIRKQQEALANETGVGATVPPKDLIAGAIDAAGEELRKTLKEALDYAETNPASFFQQMSKRIDSISDVIDDLKHGKFHNPDELFKAIFGNDTSSSLARTLVIIASVIPTLISAVNMAGTPSLEAFNYLINASSPVKLLGLGEYVNAYYKDIIKYGELKSKAAKLGVGEEELKTLLLQTIVEPGFNLMMDARRRGIVPDDYWNSWLIDQRLDNHGRDIVNGLTKELPGAGDLTRIADKRVWGLNTAPKYGQYSEMPDEYIKQMKLLGYDEQYTKWFWAAHWQLPSPNQIFEMAHRGLLEPGDRETYLGLTDWLPYFRDKLFDITFNVLTRVDVRRLYKEGLLSDNELHAQHLKMGYTEEDAYKLDAYVKSTNLPEDDTENTQLTNRVKKAIESGYTSGKLSPDEAIQMLTYMGETPAHSQQIISILEFENEIKSIQPVQVDLRANVRSVVIAAYKKGNISRNDAHNDLIAGGLNPDDVDLQLSMIELERGISLKAMAQDTAQKLFAQYTIDEKDLYTRLGALGFGADEMALIYQEALLMRDNRTKKLTVAQVTKLFRNGVIDVNQYADELRGIGYTDKDVMYIIENDIAELGG